MYNYVVCVTLLLLCVSTQRVTATFGWGCGSCNSYDDDAAYDTPDGLIYDYIVVGIGQAGSVAATRLAESGEYKVLGIEGGDRTHSSLNGTDYVAARYKVDNTGKISLDRPFTRFDIPLFYPSTFVQPTPYEEYPIIYNGVTQRSFVPRILGGAGAHNGMFWSRMTQANINSWGINGWSYDDVLPWYKKTENANGTKEGAAFPSYHGFSGPVQLTNVPATNPFYSATPIFVQACVNTGRPNNTDFNGPTRIGCGTAQFNIKSGIRANTANTYLPPAMKKGNLRLSLNSIARKVLIRRVPIIVGKPTAYGVEYEQNGEIKRAYARKEVILTLSTKFTPKLLQLSGIGDADLLESYNIKVWVNNTNVGKNLHSNHACTGTFLFPNMEIPNGFRVSDDANTYALNQGGLWAFPGHFATAYLCTNATPNCVDPDAVVSQSGGLFVPSSANKTVTNSVGTHHPTSRGEVYISSADPLAPPVVNYVINDQDAWSIVYAFKFLRQIRNTPPASTAFTEELRPGPAYQTDAELFTFVKTTAIHNGHWVGTCKMGNNGDPTAVCNRKMQVLGVDNLRVGDPSVFPQVNSHTQASAAMAGERVAAFALADA